MLGKGPVTDTLTRLPGRCAKCKQRVYLAAEPIRWVDGDGLDHDCAA